LASVPGGDVVQSPSSGLGRQLQRARESRGLTIAEVAAATKISERALQAMECERFDLLPGGIFRRHYVRAYAEAVGLHGPTCVGAYLEQFEPLDPTGGQESADWLRPGLAIVMATVLAAILGLAAVALA
jgi:cytoskeletal protein RodZ